MSAGIDWDADAYERVAAPQEEWGREVLARLPLAGDETVLDAGCGTGRVTRLLLERLPRGHVVAVDASPSMVAAARASLPAERVTLIEASLLDLDVAEPVDAVFSNATFHWISDHDRLFARLAAALRPGGRLVAQCGGAGNVRELVAAMRAAAAREPFAAHLGGEAEPWNFAGPEETERRLRAAGFAEASCGLERKPVRPPDPAAFARASGMAWHFAKLPAELHEPWADAVMEEMGTDPRFEYVRLNIDARMPA